MLAVGVILILAGIGLWLIDKGATWNVDRALARIERESAPKLEDPLEDDDG